MKLSKIEQEIIDSTKDFAETMDVPYDSKIEYMIINAIRAYQKASIKPILLIGMPHTQEIKSKIETQLEYLKQALPEYYVISYMESTLTQVEFKLLPNIELSETVKAELLTSLQTILNKCNND